MINLNGYYELYNQDVSTLKLNSLLIPSISSIISSTSPTIEEVNEIINQIQIEKKDIIDVIIDPNYSIDIKTLVKNYEKSIVGLSYGPGIIFSSGLLIHPKYVLTTSYSIRKQFLDQLNVRLDFERGLTKLDDGTDKLSLVMDYGDIVKVKQIYERNNEIGYCILELEKQVPESYYFNPHVHFNQQSNTLESSFRDYLFISHPSNGPKKVWFNFTSEKDVSKCLIGSDGYGSDGGVFINKITGEIIGIASLVENDNDENQFKLIYSSALLQHSKLLKSIYPNGKYVPQVVIPSLDDLIEALETDDQDERDQVTRGKFPGPKANDNNNYGYQFSYHHIVPAGYMDFLWMIAKEYISINQCLSDIYDQDDARINYVVWSKFNLFQGPSNRYHKKDLQELLGRDDVFGFDPSDGIEEYKPISFDKDQWEFNQSLFKLLNQCWDERNLITKKTKKETIKWIDDNYKSNKIQDLLAEEIKGSSIQNYQLTLDTILNQFNNYKLKLIQNQKNGVHQYVVDDWVMVKVNSKIDKKFYLKSI